MASRVCVCSQFEKRLIVENNTHRQSANIHKIIKNLQTNKKNDLKHDKNKQKILHF